MDTYVHSLRNAFQNGISWTSRFTEIIQIDKCATTLYHSKSCCSTWPLGCFKAKVERNQSVSRKCQVSSSKGCFILVSCPKITWFSQTTALDSPKWSECLHTVWKFNIDNFETHYWTRFSAVPIQWSFLPSSAVITVTIWRFWDSLSEPSRAGVRYLLGTEVVDLSNSSS